MTRAPLLHPLDGGADGGSFLTVLGVDADERDADPDERDTIVNLTGLLKTKN
jgi:hypothetical protein